MKNSFKTCQLTIEKLGPLGDGIARDGNRMIYVERGLPGDVVTLQTMQDSEGIWRGKIRQIEKPAPSRMVAPCPHYDQCGGCSLQHAKPDSYRQFKSAIVPDALRRQKLTTTIHAPVFLPEGSRRRATFTTARSGKTVTMGYMQRRSHNITHITECRVCDPALLNMRDAMIPHVHKFLRDGQSMDITFQLIGDAIDCVLTGPVGAKGKPDPATIKILADVTNDLNIAQLSWREMHTKPLRTVINNKKMPLTFGQITTNIPGGAFLQPSAIGEETLATFVIKALPKRVKRIADLFAGCGTFTGRLLAHGQVDAFDNAGDAIKALNTSLAGNPHKAFARDLFKQPLRREELKNYDVVVFDPPRAGAKDQCMHLAKSKVPCVIAVSCNPTSFARDARILCDGGYKLVWAQPVDQFIYAYHMELVAVFVK